MSKASGSDDKSKLGANIWGHKTFTPSTSGGRTFYTPPTSGDHNNFRSSLSLLKASSPEYLKTEYEVRGKQAVAEMMTSSIERLGEASRAALANENFKRSFHRDQASGNDTECKLRYANEDGRLKIGLGNKDTQAIGQFAKKDTYSSGIGIQHKNVTITTNPFEGINASITWSPFSKK